MSMMGFRRLALAQGLLADASPRSARSDFADVPADPPRLSPEADGWRRHGGLPPEEYGRKDAAEC